MLFNGVSYLTIFLMLSTIVFFSISATALFLIEEKISMIFCRILSLFGTLLLCYCSKVLYNVIFGPALYATFNSNYSLSTSIKLFLFLMTFISIFGYFFQLPLIYILQDYDFALHYSNFWFMAITDISYCFAITIYFILQLFYIWFFFPGIGFFENDPSKKYIFGFSLIANFWQIWLFETLIAKEKNCEELYKHNQTCIGQRYYFTNFTVLSEAEHEAYYINELISPFSYSCTMELLVVYLILLCYPKLKHETKKVSVSNNKKYVIHNKVLLKITMTIVMIISVLCLLTKLMAMFDDEIHHRKWEKETYHSFRLAALLTASVLFIWFNFIYGNVKSNSCDSKLTEKENNKLKERNEESKKFYKGFLIKGVYSKTDEPELIILKISWWASLILLSISSILQCIGYVYGKFKGTDNILYSIIPNVLTVILCAYNYELIWKFFTTNKQTFNNLKNETFTTNYMVPFQIIRQFIRAATRFAMLLDPEIFFISLDIFDQWIVLIEAIYPFTMLIHITSALCWCHIMEEFFNEGAYTFYLKHSVEENKENKASDESTDII